MNESSNDTKSSAESDNLAASIELIDDESDAIGSSSGTLINRFLNRSLSLFNFLSLSNGESKSSGLDLALVRRWS